MNKEPEDLFLDNDKLPIDPEGIVEDINVSEIEDQAKDESVSMCKNLKDIYFEDEYWVKHPKLKERIDVELESLRVLIKMRKSDEIVHDLCLRNIGQCGNNASLYAALSRIQSSMLSIQKQMDETIRNINVILKGVQLEIPFDEKSEENTQDTNPQCITRGSKKFIEQMRADLEQQSEDE